MKKKKKIKYSSPVIRQRKIIVGRFFFSKRYFNSQNQIDLLVQAATPTSSCGT